MKRKRNEMAAAQQISAINQPKICINAMANGWRNGGM